MRYTIYHIIIGMLAVLLVCGACQDDLEGNPLNSNMLTLQLQTSAITRALEVGEGSGCVFLPRIQRNGYR